MKNLKKGQIKNDRGITLVALIITIIILIILAAVTINSLTHDDLAKMAIEGTEKYDKAQTYEMNMLNEIDTMVKETVRNIEEGTDSKTELMCQACGAKMGEAEFMWEGTTSCTCTVKCTVCEHEETQECTIDYVDTIQATPGHAGERRYTAVCYIYGQRYEDIEIVETPALPTNPGGGGRRSALGHHLRQISVYK